MTDRKEQILRTAAEILETKSFAAFSYQDLADRLGIRKASIHHHFPTKDALGQALLVHYVENTARVMTELTEGVTPAEALTAIFDSSERVLFDETAKVCPSGAFEIDANAMSAEMLEGLRNLKLGFMERFAGFLDDARREGSISFLGDARDQAAVIMSAMQGAREAEPILGREFFRSIIRQLKRSLGL